MKSFGPNEYFQGLSRDALMDGKIIFKYPSCARDKYNSCENDCTDGRDPCYINANRNSTWATWHVPKRSSDVDLEHLASPLIELTVVSEVNDGEKLEIVFEGKESQDTMKVDVSWNINLSKQITIKIDGRLKYEMPTPTRKLYGLSVG